MSYRHNLVLILLFIVSSFMSLAQNTTLYLLPGMGTDFRIFHGMDFGEEVNHQVIHYPTNSFEFSGLDELARNIAAQIDTNRQFILVGVSMGGMLAMELSKIVNPEAIILVSSIKSSAELPFKYKVGRFFPVHKFFTERMLVRKAENPKTWDNVTDSYLREVYPKMLKDCGAKLLRWQMSSIINWRFENHSEQTPIFRIHGSDDHILPLRKFTADIVFYGASHRMISNNRKEIIEEVRKFLSSEKFI